jgi:hypothetical protein
MKARKAPFPPSPRPRGTHYAEGCRGTIPYDNVG